METTILIALGSNRRHGRHGRPEGVLRAVVAELAARGLATRAVSRIRPTAPIGPGGRRFANGAVAVRSGLPLRQVLTLIKQVERDFGRRGGRRWGDRVLDLDIIGAGDAVIRTGPPDRAASGHRQPPLRPRSAGRYRARLAAPAVASDGKTVARTRNAS